MTKDLTGQLIGYWKVLYKSTSKYNDRGIRWVCQCRCGVIKDVRSRDLISGNSQCCRSCSSILRENNHAFANKKGLVHGNITVLSQEKDKTGRLVYRCLCTCGKTFYTKAIKAKSCGCSRRLNIVNQRYGSLVVLEMLPNYKNKQTWCRCICDCGQTKNIRADLLKTGNTQSCGCSTKPNLTDKIFGRLSVVSYSHLNDQNQKIWNCLCSCGNEIKLSSHVLLTEHTKSCGCLRSESTSSLEIKVREILRSLAIEFIAEKTFPSCVNKKVLRFDFYLPKHNLCIECDGQQHFIPIEYFGGDAGFKQRQKHDLIKNQFCKDNKISLIRIPYTDSYQQIYEKILNIIKDPVTITV